MGQACFKPSSNEENQDSPNVKRFPIRKTSRVNSSKRQEDVRLNDSKRTELNIIRLNSSRNREEGIRFNPSTKEEGVRLNSMGRRGGETNGPSKAKLNGNGNVALLDKKVNGSTRVYYDQIVEKKKREKVGPVFVDYPGKGSVPNVVEAEQVAAGWPAWLSAVAGEAIKGWLPRRADTFEKLEKIGQGTYSSVYKARDIIRDKLVALKRVRFDNLDMESVKFMAREILILRSLDHPNVIQLEGLITSSKSCSLYIVFEYMEHDLTGLASNPSIKFTESQVKCFMQQLLRGLDYCHSHGVLHRDIKGSNLLIDDNGVLKIADLGLASFFDPYNSLPLTSRVVTLWYRPPELLLGASHYGAAVDLWSTGCLLAELYNGKPILPGKTEVEQLHKIYKLCGSPSEDYWRKLKMRNSTVFKPAQPYQRCVTETFKEFPPAAISLVDTLLSLDPSSRGTAALALKSEFFTTKPFACDPSSLPKYPPSKEIDAKLRKGGRRFETVGDKDPKTDADGKQAKESQDNIALNAKNADSITTLQKRKGYSNSLSRREQVDPRREEPGSGFLMGPHKQISHAAKELNRDTHRTSFSGPLVPSPTWTKSVKEFDHTTMVPNRAVNLTTLSGLVATRIITSEDRRDHKPGPSQREVLHNNELEGARKQDRKRYTQRVADSYQIDHNGKTSIRNPTMYGPRGRKIFVSGPLLGPSNNVEKMLKDHDRRIQEHTRQARYGNLNTQIKQGHGAGL